MLTDCETVWSIYSLVGALGICILDPVVAAVTVHLSHGVEVFVAEFVGHASGGAPQLLTLGVMGITLAVVAVSLSSTQQTYSVIIMQSIFSKIFTKDTPCLALTGELWGVFCDFKIWFLFCSCRCIVVCNIMIYHVHYNGTGLYKHWYSNIYVLDHITEMSISTCIQYHSLI